MKSLSEEYTKLRESYYGLPLTTELKFDTELVSTVISQLHCGKAPDIDGITAEHLSYSHPSLPVVLSKFFDAILISQYIPTGFWHSYIVPIPKPKDSRSKAMTCDDFRGIAISPVLAKVFENCFLVCFKSMLTSAHNQFGFKMALVATMQSTLYAISSIV